MRVLFIYRGYGKELGNAVIDPQRDSLVREGIEIESFPIAGSGVVGYVSAMRALRRLLRSRHFDVLHAHYSYSGFMAGLVAMNRTTCSLMGSDILRRGRVITALTRCFSRFMWRCTIVKSREMKKFFPRALLIPNGLDLSCFGWTSREEAMKVSGFSHSERNIIFVAQDPNARVKNLPLAQESVSLLDDESIKLHVVSGKTSRELRHYYNAADVLLLTSVSEGSPNVIKEAMACNLPIVSVEVGDVRAVLDGTEGTYLCSYDGRDICGKLRKALDFGRRTNGRAKVQHMDSRVVAERLIAVYRSVSGIC